MTVEPPDPAAEDLNWDEVLAWLPRFTHARFHAGQWAGGEEQAPGVRTLPWVDYTSDVLEFIHQLYDLQVVAPFDWGTWIQERGRALWEGPQRLAEASLEDCRMLLASHLRADRFTEGHLLHAFESGHIVRILKRVEWLLDSGWTGPQRQR
jgi:hypothetical protein